jgi:DNA-binding transcriptional MerR regulator/methylmalonyl-CoA mutase cobalamin-binding subunit
MNVADTPKHTVRLTALRTGLTPHTLRAWERRHHVVTPTRTDGGQRLYSDLDVERLRLIRLLTERGHSIRRLAAATLLELEAIATEEDVTAEIAVESPAEDAIEEFRSAALRAVQRLDAPELQSVLERAAVTLGVPTFLDQVASPAIRRIGQRWREGEMSVGHEHMATAVFERVLGWIVQLYEVKGVGPRLIVATPPRETHKLGALLAAAAAAAEGWDVIYLGADLPVADILSSARQVSASAVALSIVYPTDGPTLVADLILLRDGLGKQVRLIVGGAAVPSHRDALTAMGVEVVESLAEFRQELHGLKKQR